MANPKDLKYNNKNQIIVNGKDIDDDINEAIRDWDNSEYKEFGIIFGRASGKVLKDRMKLNIVLIQNLITHQRNTIYKWVPNLVVVSSLA